MTPLPSSMKSTTIILAAITSITIMEVIAITYQVNGATLSAAIAAIAGLGGYYIARKRYKK